MSRHFFVPVLLISLFGFTVESSFAGMRAKPDPQEQAEEDNTRGRGELKTQRSKLDVFVRESGGNQPNGVQTTIKGNVRTTTAKELNREIKIIENPKTGIVVEIVRQYGPQDVNRLKKDHPELTDYIELFPKQVGNHNIELSLSIKSVYQGRSPEQLKTRHIKAFNIYRKYAGNSADPVNR